MRQQGQRAMGGGKLRTAAALLALLAGACESSKVWVSDDVPQEEWASDRMVCKEQARVQAEREFLRDQQSRSMTYNPGGQWSGQMNQFSAQRSQGGLFASCMTSRGYKLVPADQAPQAAEPAAADPATGPGAEGKAAPPQ